MNKKVNKDLNFLKGKKISRKGIFDNKEVYENTLKAFETIINSDYILEIQVRMLKDGTLILFDEEDMERLLHVEGSIDKLTFEELEFMAKYEILTFDKFLNLVNGNVPLLIELKSKTRRNALEIKVAELLDKYNGIYAIESFNVKSLKWFDKNRSDVVLGYLMDKKINKNEPVFFKKYDFLNINIDLFSDKKVRKMREDKCILGYVVEDKETYEKKIGVYDNLSCYNILEIDEK